MTEKAGPATQRGTAEPQGGYRDRWWMPRFWTGINLTGWLSLLARNRFAVGPTRLGMAAILSFAAVVNSSLWLLQWLFLGRRIDRTEIVDAPIFIIGHWRSGTTLLHELLVLDPRHTYPDTYCCFVPNHFLISRWLFEPIFGYLLPSQRPMDNMPFGWDRPQEDEFALCNMGARSPYLSLCFPNRPAQDGDFFELADLPEPARRRWERSFVWFLKCVTARTPKRIVLKSPPHTFRVRTLLKLFPKARFIHVVRDPLVVFPSTMNLWKRLSRDQGLQFPRDEGLEEYVFDTFVKMYDVFERDKELIPPGQFCEVRYEDLGKDMIGHVRRIYDELELGQFESVLPALQEFVAGQKDYRKNRYRLSDAERDEIVRRWGGFMERYGYSAEGNAARRAT